MTSPRRLAYLTAALAATTAALVVAVPAGAVLVGVLLAFAIAPDLPLVIGLSESPEPGVLAPRAVPAYNAVHRLALPVLLTAVGLLSGRDGLLVAGLAWLAHVGFDRAAGYGLRTATGHISGRRPADRQAEPVGV